ncbi:MAG: bifunctional precorrin-2 dehydrogenase/sirohydrochlorin ferrochelatase [Magnetococcales bacterium]|nr:bifunctional precorrin-2 dehydrogenase/sirohydrochlorin ferrochelatase [Magnetococcales bacterium]
MTTSENKNQPVELFPIFLNLTDKSCLVVGGGEAARPKVLALLETGAKLTVVSPKLDPVLAQKAAEGQFFWIPELFQLHHLDDMWFVVSTLEEVAVNTRIHQEAERRGLFLNVVDQPQFCSALWPARLTRQPVTLAFSTGGSSPALAGYLRRKLEKLLPENFGELALWLGRWREKINPELPDLAARGRFWRTLLDQGLGERFLEGDQPGAEGMIRKSLEKERS